jgi:hypothetical protein
MQQMQMQQMHAAATSERKGTDWEKILSNPIALKFVESIMERRSSPLDSVLPELMSSVTTSILGTSSAMMQKVMEFQAAPPQEGENPMAEKLAVLQKIGEMVTPSVNNIIAKIAEIKAGNAERRETSPARREYPRFRPDEERKFLHFFEHWQVFPRACGIER